jgi:hypothetical protein
MWLKRQDILKIRKDKVNRMFHDNFTWDNSESANKHREQEAQKIVINVDVLTKPSQEK